MTTQDIRWIQRFQNYRKAFGHLYPFFIDFLCDCLPVRCYASVTAAPPRENFQFPEFLML